MAALVQPFPQQSGTVTMLQTQPSSAGGIIPTSPGQPPQQYVASQQRNNYYGGTNTVTTAPASYRTAQAPIQPYAFTSTPSLNTQRQPQHSQHSQQGQPAATRCSSVAPSLPMLQSFDSTITLTRPSRGPASPSAASQSTGTVPPAGGYTFGTRDDLSLPNNGIRRVQGNQSAHPSFQPQHTLNTQNTQTRPTPDRYRRTVPRTVTDPTGPQLQPQKALSAAPSGSGMAAIGHLYAGGGVTMSDPRLGMSRSQAHRQSDSQRRNSVHDAMMTTSDDMLQYRQQTLEEAKRFRRQSVPSQDHFGTFTPSSPRMSEGAPPPGSDKSKPASSPDGAALSPAEAARCKQGSSESVSSISATSRRSSTSRNASATVAPTGNPASVSATISDRDTADKNPLKSVSIPPRGSSDAATRIATPSSQMMSATDAVSGGDARVSGTAHAAAGRVSPAGNPAAKDTDAAPKKAAAVPSHLESPAMRHLSAINQKGGKLRSKTSRLRRALSFGSAADFQNANDAGNVRAVSDSIVAAKPDKKPAGDEVQDAEQARIAKQQEEAGIGSSIYANAKIFSGSTDNLSISSTASSASIMIRKMGRDVKKRTRSFVGLFRPKSSMGSPASADAGGADSTPSMTAEATISMVTVEAERERVNVHADVRGSGGTGFPRLERNSIDAARAAESGRPSSSASDLSGALHSDSAEVAAVIKGILKNTNGRSSPSRNALDGRGSAFELQHPPAISDSPASSAPSTPNDDPLGHKRAGSVALGGEDYFASAMRLRQDSKSGNSTPQGSMRRNATFSPRIIFHDTWPSQEYDRRGEISTCNRLTPMLAQQIKEELNIFKMEMEVHENSKIYTHFF